MKTPQESRGCSILKQLEDSLELRVNALEQAIKETAADIASTKDGDTNT